MWRYICLIVGLLSTFSMVGCALDSTPKRLGAYLPQPSPQTVDQANVVLQAQKVPGALVVLNDTGFEKSAPQLRRGTLENLGEYLITEIHKQLPIRLSSVVYPDGLESDDSAAQFIQLAQEQNVPYLLLAVLSSSENEVFDRFPMHGNYGGGGMASVGLTGYRAKNHARLELALIDGQTGHAVERADGQAWATLERLDVPLKSKLYPVVRRADTHAPIYPNSEREAHETLRWVSGQGAIAKAVMSFEELLVKHQSAVYPGYQGQYGNVTW